MPRITRIGRTFFAVALLGLAIEHFIFGEFITGRAPAWPDGVAGGTVWAVLTGVAFIGVSIAIMIGKRGRAAAIFGAALVFAWALVRNVPIAAADSLFAATWTVAGKSLVFTGGALVIAATLPPFPDRHALARFLNADRAFMTVGRTALGIFMVITGVQHFIFTAFVASLIPDWFPGDAVIWTWFAGVALIAGGIGLQVPRTARLAALLSGLMVFSWFWIVHLPRTFAGVSDSIAVFEALAVSGIAFALAGNHTRRVRPRPPEARVEVASSTAGTSTSP